MDLTKQPNIKKALGRLQFCICSKQGILTNFTKITHERLQTLAIFWTEKSHHSLFTTLSLQIEILYVAQCAAIPTITKLVFSAIPNEGFKVAPEIAKYYHWGTVFARTLVGLTKFEVYLFYPLSMQPSLMANGAIPSINSDLAELHSSPCIMKLLKNERYGNDDDESLAMITIKQRVQLWRISELVDQLRRESTVIGYFWIPNIPFLLILQSSNDFLNACVDEILWYQEDKNDQRWQLSPTRNG